MFKILSKESNIFSIPFYIGFLLLGIIGINIFHFDIIGILSTIIAFVGVALGYFAFNTIGLNHRTHIPLFLYTMINISLYPTMLDIGISWTILSNALFILILTQKESNGKDIFVLTGAILGLNYIFLPTVWPMSIFFILHIIATSKHIFLNLFRFLFGIILIIISYLSLAYFLGYHSWNMDYLPRISFTYSGIGKDLILLTPTALFIIYALLDYLMQYNKTSSNSKFKYLFLLLFISVQIIVIGFYMGKSTQYLLIISLPVSIIISRALYYLPKNIYQEISIWVIFLSLFSYRFFQNIHF